jgi:menaquinol-cytochrome c reductase iron-sulfur subunit
VADELERPGQSPGREEPEPHLPSPTIWPFAFAGGAALILIGLIVNLWVTVVGAAIAVIFGFLWIREATREVRGAPEPEPTPAPPVAEEAAGVEEPERYTRSRFLEGSTLGIGALIGGIVTAPIVGFAVAPAFVGQGFPDVDLGPLDNFPEGEFVTATFKRPDESDVGRRTAYIRNNGIVNDIPSLTVISSRCVHLGCPTQPQGLPGEAQDVETSQGRVSLTPTASVSGFQCPCHGGAYDSEGNRTAGPPVRALDRYEYSIRNGNVWLGTPYSVASVDGTSAEARIRKYRAADPGVHVDGPEQYLYPYAP